MKTILLAAIAGLFMLGAVPLAWGYDFRAAESGISITGTGTDRYSQFFPHRAPGPAPAGLDHDPAETGFSSSLAMNPGEGLMDYSSGATGVGRINSGMIYHGFNGSQRVSYQESSSASGQFSFSASYGFQSSFAPFGATNPYSFMGLEFNR